MALSRALCRQHVGGCLLREGRSLESSVGHPDYSDWVKYHCNPGIMTCGEVRPRDGAFVVKFKVSGVIGLES